MRARPVESKPDPVHKPPTRLHGVLLYFCPVFSSHLTPEACTRNREIAGGKRLRVHRYRGKRARGKIRVVRRDRSGEVVSGADQEVREARQPCLTCPGAKALWESLSEPRNRSRRGRKSKIRG